MFIKCEAFVIETKLKAEIEYSFSRITVTFAINDQLNKLITIRTARTRTVI